MLHVRLRKALRNFTLDLQFQTEACTTALLGPSGAGKTLTLDCIAGFVRPDTGLIQTADTMLFDSASRINLTPQQRKCGYVFQNYALFPHLTVRQNLQFAAPAREQAPRIHDMLSRFHLAEHARKYPRELSGGQQQRCSIARALLREPRLLLLDEPARGLDVLLREELYTTLRQVQQEFSTPIVLVTHEWNECRALADMVVVLEAGRIVTTGSVPYLEQNRHGEFLSKLLGQTG